MTTRAKFARLARYLREFVEVSHIFLENGLWRVSASLASVGDSGESAQHGLANVGESGESCIFPKTAILASTRTRQKRRVLREYSNSLNSLSSSHCLVLSLF